jgi:hypothetical protein
VDVVVTEMPDGRSWGLTDLLGRDMGRVFEASPAVFEIKPTGNAVETMGEKITSRSFGSLDAALAAIEEHTRGVCRRGPGDNMEKQSRGG